MFDGFKPPLFNYYLNATEVADRIIKAILLKEQVVYIPWVMKYLVVIYKLMPSFLSDWLYFNFSIIYLLISVASSTKYLKGREDNKLYFI